MNYRHAFHAGNYADALKHALFVRLLRALQQKEKGLVVVDTHAGRGSYDLSLASEGDSRARTPEWPDGIGRLWDRTDLPPEVEDYVALVRGFDRSRGNLSDRPRFYPGSPALGRLLARPQDRLELWERHPAECAALRAAFEGAPRVSIHEADGYGAARACLPPREKRALVLIDPPFEAADEWAQVTACLSAGLVRLPSATFAVWYPLTGRARVDALVAFLESARAPAFAAEVIAEPGAARMRGCGVAVVNPPWKFEAQARAVASYLAGVFEPERGASSSVRWIVPE